MFDAALALENMVLEAQELGIGTLYIGAFDAKKAATVLEVPEGTLALFFYRLDILMSSLKQDKGKIFPRLSSITSLL